MEWPEGFPGWPKGDGGVGHSVSLGMVIWQVRARCQKQTDGYIPGHCTLAR